MADKCFVADNEYSKSVNVLSINKTFKSGSFQGLCKILLLSWFINLGLALETYSPKGIAGHNLALPL